ncbi:MAG: excinuclease ABC subunit UvrC [Chitinivibrionales bacterium]|nr:excinuclease ABC subunit UvrC [Chitinivibrionales bacterium]MBD3394393.1 excinuclease ABC subunit UvrC [Chitinivibrionales bacterium]
MTPIQKLRASAESFPRTPGVYLMKDARDRLLYIGKARDLRSRIKTYLGDQDERRQVPALLARVDHIDWIATSSESEALILEANLVRKHCPRYNVDLKDDKHYPYLKVTTNEAFPRLLVVRRVHKDGARYFGPYTDVTTMRRMVSYAKKAFTLCDCTRILAPKPDSRPCINYAMGRCSGACAGKISQEDYRENITLLLKFLSGRSRDVISDLETRMADASARLEFELAASLRDQIELVASASRLQKVDLRAEKIDRDVFGARDDGRRLCLCVLAFRQGLLMSTRHFVLERRKWNYASASPDALIARYYQDAPGELPAEVLLPADMGFDAGLLEQWFSSQRGRSVRVHVPRKGRKAEMVGMAAENADLHLKQRASRDGIAGLEELRRVLDLPREPRVIEAFDISNLGESFAVAGMVRFTDGLPQKPGYRKFRIRTVAGQNDFAMLMEAVSRRLCRLEREGRPFPDLMLIDGGKGQLHAAMKVLGEFEDPPMIASLAKKEEVLFSPYTSRPVGLPETHPARRLVERIRDEAHRFAVTYHRFVRDRQFKGSSLQQVPGVGPKRARLLLKRFGSLARLKRAPVEEVASVKGFSRKSAEALKARLL